MRPAAQNIARVLKTCAAYGVPNAGGAAIPPTADPAAVLLAGEQHRALIGAMGVPKLLEVVADDKAPRDARNEAAMCVPQAHLLPSPASCAASSLCCGPLADRLASPPPRRTIGLLSSLPANRAPLFAAGALRLLPTAVVNPELSLEARTAAAVTLKHLLLPPAATTRVIEEALLRSPASPGPPVLVQRFTPLGGAVAPPPPADPHNLLAQSRTHPFAATRREPSRAHLLIHGLQGEADPCAESGPGHDGAGDVSGAAMLGTAGPGGGGRHPGGDPGGPVGTATWPYGGWDSGSGWGGGVLVKAPPTPAADPHAAGAAPSHLFIAAGVDAGAITRHSPTDESLEGMVARMVRSGSRLIA